MAPLTYLTCPLEHLGSPPCTSHPLVGQTSSVTPGQHSRRVKAEAARSLLVFLWGSHIRSFLPCLEHRACHGPAQIQGVEKKTPTPGVRSGKVRLQGSLDTSKAWLTRVCYRHSLFQLLMFTDLRCNSVIVICMEYWWESISGLYAKVHSIFSQNVYQCAYVYIMFQNMYRMADLYFIVCPWEKVIQKFHPKRTMPVQHGSSAGLCK